MKEMDMESEKRGGAEIREEEVVMDLLSVWLRRSL